MRKEFGGWAMGGACPERTRRSVPVVLHVSAQNEDPQTLGKVSAKSSSRRRDVLTARLVQKVEESYHVLVVLATIRLTTSNKRTVAVVARSMIRFIGLTSVASANGYCMARNPASYQRTHGLVTC